MKQIITLIITLLYLVPTVGQNIDVEQVAGRVSYKSVQNTYVSFTSTQGISIGDTLYVINGTKTIPMLVVTQRSSISCVTTAIGEPVPNVNDIVYAFSKTLKPATKEVEVMKEKDVAEAKDKSKSSKKKKEKEEFYGRLSMASYSNFSNTTASNSQRMRYTLSLQGEHIKGSKMSAETYVTFSHKSGEWGEIKDNLFNGLKIYSLALKYDVSENTNVWLGRKINPLVSNIGAIDGVQAQTTHKNFTYGLAGGTRPDYLDYGFNADLVQFGAYVGHQVKGEMGSAQSSLAIFEQMNGANTDRRFTYFQHSNSMIKNLSLFASCELDLFKLEDDKPVNTLDLTGLYVSARYRPWRQLSIFTSYDARKNVVYYETYRSLADRILENETRQGYRVQFRIRPFKYFSMSLNGGYRYRKGDISPSENASAYMSYSRIPWIDASLSLNGTYLKTGYLDGLQYGANLSKDFFRGALMGTLNYRLIDYNFTNSPVGLFQNIGELSLSWRIMKKLSLTFDYEITFEDANIYNRLYFGLIKRF